MTAAERRRWAATWRERAANQERMARVARRDGDPEYADDLEAAARDNRLAADRIEAWLKAEA